MKMNRKEIYGVVNRNDRNYWTRIGVAFENKRDGSWNLLFDYLPVNGTTTIQLRDPRPAQPAQPEGTADAPASPEGISDLIP
jgi:hypothetical protein